MPDPSEAVAAPVENGGYVWKVGGTGVSFPSDDIPDSAIHRWRIDEGSGDTIADDIGSADGTLVGPAWTSGVWEGDYALNGDGTDDHVETTTWGSFGSHLSEDFAVLMTIETNIEERRCFVGARASSLTAMRFWMTDEGTLRCRLSDSDTNRIDVETSSSGFSDGKKHRICWNKTGNTADDLNIYVNGNSVSTVTNNDVNLGSTTDFDYPVSFFAWNDRGDLQDFYDGVLDNVISHGGSLTQSEIEDDYNNQPWS